MNAGYHQAAGHELVQAVLLRKLRLNQSISDSQAIDLLLHDIHAIEARIEGFSERLQELHVFSAPSEHRACHLLQQLCSLAPTQHTSAYVSIRQHTSAYVSIREQRLPATSRRLTAAVPSDGGGRDTKSGTPSEVK